MGSIVFRAIYTRVAHPIAENVLQCAESDMFRKSMKNAIGPQKRLQIFREEICKMWFSALEDKFFLYMCMDSRFFLQRENCSLCKLL